MIAEAQIIEIRLGTQNECPYLIIVADQAATRENRRRAINLFRLFIHGGAIEAVLPIGIGLVPGSASLDASIEA
jgi:hypothetical protein